MTERSDIVALCCVVGCQQILERHAGAGRPRKRCPEHAEEYARESIRRWQRENPLAVRRARQQVRDSEYADHIEEMPEKLSNQDAKLALTQWFAGLQHD